MPRMFGTDGVRGIANRQLTGELAFKLGQAGALALTSEVHRPRILVGHDSRASGDMLRAALGAGICSVGAETVDLGMLPTPGVAYLARKFDADAGVMISASHNPMEYNGIKWFDGKGFKLSDALEDQIEAICRDATLIGELPVGDGIGRLVRAKQPGNTYADYLVSCAECRFDGYRVALDCANGASSVIAPAVFERLGAQVIAMGNTPDGSNINQNCGSMHTQHLQQLVTESGADIGFAFDGDADRLIAVDEFGVVVDGDKVLAVCAIDLGERGALPKNGVAITLMSNLGMRRTLEQAGIQAHITDVGDRYVLERMLQKGLILGGEQSGHTIFLEHSTTGDGILTALQLMGILARKRATLSELAGVVQIYPQVLINIIADDHAKAHALLDDDVRQCISETEAELGNEGRVFVRKSGTEPLIRIMLEGPSVEEIETHGLRIAKAIEEKYHTRIK